MVKAKRTRRGKTKKYHGVVGYAKNMYWRYRTKNNLLSSYRSLKRFMRVTTFSNSANLQVDGVVLQKGASAMTINVNGSGGVIQYGAFAFKINLSDVNNVTEFTSLFDRYKIKKVKVVLTPFFNMGVTGAAYSAGSAQANVLVHTAIDYDDVTIPSADDAGINILRQYETYKVTRLGSRRLVRTWTPRFAQAVYGSGAFTSYVQGSKTIWLDCASPDIEHYGLKGVVEVNNTLANAIFYVKCEYTAYLEFKATR